VASLDICFHVRSVESKPKQYSIVSVGDLLFLVIEPLSSFPQ